MFTSRKKFVYPVKKLEHAIEWYSDICSATPVMESSNIAVFSFGGGLLRLEGPGTDTLSCKDSPAQAVNPETTYSAVYWEVDSVDAMLQRLLSKGAILHTPVSTIQKMRTAKVIDPFGNVIGLFEKCPSFGFIPPHTTLAAFCRSLATRDHRQFLRGPDHFASIFLDIEAKELLEDADKRRFAIAKLVTSPVYGYSLAKTDWFDQEFKDACHRSIPQIVILGAGYDTRAIRFRDHLKTTKIFEVDTLSLLNHKADRLTAASISSVSNLVYVPIDFEKDSLADKLHQAGFDPHQKTLFFWEGGSYYQSSACIESLLDFFKSDAVAGSSLAADMLQEELPPANPEEPYKFWVPTGDIGRFLARYDLTVKNLITDGEMVQKYLTDRNGHAAEKCLSSFYFLHAEKDLQR